MLSSFDGLRREVARLTLEKLIEDGRIHPSRIEEMYYHSKAELEDHVRQAGRAGRVRGELRRVPRGARQDPRPAALPHELRPERAQAHARGRPPRRADGERAAGEREDRQARRAAARHRQGDDPRGRGLARADLGAAGAPLRRVAGRRARDRGAPLRGAAADGRGGAPDRRRRRSPPPGPEPAARASRTTSSGSRRSRSSPRRSLASRRPTRSRPAARSA